MKILYSGYVKPLFYFTLIHLILWPSFSNSGIPYAKIGFWVLFVNLKRTGILPESQLPEHASKIYNIEKDNDSPNGSENLHRVYPANFSVFAEAPPGTGCLRKTISCYTMCPVFPKLPPACTEPVPKAQHLHNR